MTGFSENNEVLFRYQNKDQNINQTFGVGLFFYKAHIHQEKKMPNGEPVDDKFLTELQKLQKVTAEGAYTFLPEWEEPGVVQHLYQFS